MTAENRTKFYEKLREHFFLLAGDLKVTPVEAVGVLAFLTAEVTTGQLFGVEDEGEAND